jgi:Fe(3+) dicitrate transport protein
VLSAGLDWTHARGIGVRVDGDLTGAQFADDLETVAPTADGLRGVIPRWAVVHVAARAPVGGGRGAPVLVAAVKNVADRAYITDRQEGIMTGLPRRLTLGVEWGR